MLDQYAAATGTISPNCGNKQEEKVEGFIGICSFMRTYHSRPTHARKRSNEILSYQIKVFNWLISLSGRCWACTWQLCNTFMFSFTRCAAPSNTSLIWKLCEKEIFQSQDINMTCLDVLLLCLKSLLHHIHHSHFSRQVLHGENKPCMLYTHDSVQDWQL